MRLALHQSPVEVREGMRLRRRIFLRSNVDLVGPKIGDNALLEISRRFARSQTPAFASRLKNIEQFVSPRK